MKERIFEIIKQNQFTAWRFAELIEVQPSSISHILSGRNKPSFDFIEKILTRFPEISPDWLILGHGDMIRVGYSEEFVIHELDHNQEPTLFDLNNEEDSSNGEVTNVNNTELERLTVMNDSIITDVKPDKPTEIKTMIEEYPPKLPNVDTDQVERVMIFYTNGTFSTYTPK